MKTVVFFLVTLIMLSHIAGCGANNSVVTLYPTNTSQPVVALASPSELTITPTSTSTPKPTSTSTPQPTTTPIPEPTSTSTPEPTTTPTPILYLLEVNVFHDLNSNETQDAGEPPIAGVTVNTSGLSCTTETTGKCELGHIVSGNYLLSIDASHASITDLNFIFADKDVSVLKDGLAFRLHSDTPVEVALGQGPLPLPVIRLGGFGGIFNGFMTASAPNHDGLDLWIEGQGEQPIMANIGGTVEAVGSDCNHVTVLVRKRGMEFNVGMGHLTRVVVKAGQRIEKGDVIGYIDPTLYDSVNRQPGTIVIACTTQPHVHYNVYGPGGVGAGPWGFLDPALLAPGRGNPVPLFDTTQEAEEFFRK